MDLREILEAEFRGLADGLDMRGEGRMELSGFWLEQLCGSWWWFP